MHLLGRICHQNVLFVAAALFKHEIVLIKCVVFVVVKILLIRPFRRCVMKHTQGRRNFVCLRIYCPLSSISRQHWKLF